MLENPFRATSIYCLHHYAYSTEQTYTEWIKHYIFFHKLKYPGDMREREIEEFLTYLAVERNVAASTQNQALNRVGVMSPVDML